MNWKSKLWILTLKDIIFFTPGPNNPPFFFHSWWSLSILQMNSLMCPQGPDRPRPGSEAPVTPATSRPQCIMGLTLRLLKCTPQLWHSHSLLRDSKRPAGNLPSTAFYFCLNSVWNRLKEEFTQQWKFTHYLFSSHADGGSGEASMSIKDLWTVQ